MVRSLRLTLLITNDFSIECYYKALSMFEPAYYGPRMKSPAFVETLRTVCTFTDDEIMVRGVEVLRQMSPDDWSAYDYVNSLSAEQSA